MMILLIRKALMMGLSLFLVTVLTFVIMKSIPGDPFNDEKALPAEVHAALMKHYGLDKSISTQYWQYVTAALQFDFGPSLIDKNRTVTEIIKNSFPVSAILGLEAILIAGCLGGLIGIFCAINAGKWPDRLGICCAAIAISVPSFILAVALQYIFALKLGLFPVARWGSVMQTILPAVSLAALPTAFIARLVRANMLEVLQQDYIKAAFAKGLSTSVIVMRHAIRNAFLPLLGYFGQMAANVLTGSFVIEKIFAIPGLGHWFVSSVANRDYPVIMGTTIFYSCILLVSMFLVDVLYMTLDPRQRGNK